MFSLAVKLAGLDDFLAPAQDCIVPILLANDGLEPRKMSAERPNLIKSSQADATGKISLSDCLACSGCVTSAEAILVEQHSHVELLKVLEEKVLSPGESPRAIVISISFQSLAALACLYGLSTRQCLYQIARCLHGQGVDYVFDMELAHLLYFNQASLELAKESSLASNAFPLVGSQCPGWTCYAEKTAPIDIIKHMSKVPTVMQWHGLMVKSLVYELHNLGVTRAQLDLQVGFNDWHRELLLKRIGSWQLLPQLFSPRLIYHVAVEPCYDKKLESIRPEFTRTYKNETFPLTDLVLGTNQFKTFLDQLGFTAKIGEDIVQIASIEQLMSIRMPRGAVVAQEVDCLGDWAAETESCGYAAAHAHALAPATATSLFVNGNNSDHKIFRSNGHRVEIASGLRNLKNFTNKIMKDGAHDGLRSTDLLACPKGCLNGGAHAFLLGTHVTLRQLSVTAANSLRDRQEQSRHRQWAVTLATDYLAAFLKEQTDQQDCLLPLVLCQSRASSKPNLTDHFHFNFKSLTTIASAPSSLKW